MEKNITIILLLLGRYEKQVAELDEKLKELRQLKEDAEIIVAADSTQWAEAPLMKMFQVENPKAVVVGFGEHPDLKGVRRAQTPLMKCPLVLMTQRTNPWRYKGPESGR